MDNKLKVELIGLGGGIFVLALITGEANTFASVWWFILADALVSALIVTRVNAIIKLVTTKRSE